MSKLKELKRAKELFYKNLRPFKHDGEQTIAIPLSDMVAFWDLINAAITEERKRAAREAVIKFCEDFRINMKPHHYSNPKYNSKISKWLEQNNLNE